MAKKESKSVAQKVASASKKNKTAKKNEKKEEKVATEAKSQSFLSKWDIPVRFFSSVILLATFVILLVIFLVPEGALVRLLENFIHGIIGRIGFLTAIPVSLYLFIIHAFSGKRPIRMRTFCLGMFVLICGCIGHIFSGSIENSFTLNTISQFYIDGISGASGGVLCGIFTHLIYWLCGRWITYIVLILGALLTLLAGMQITIPSIIRAVRNRPRAEWESAEEEKPEPASIVVNHIANKRIEHINQKKQASLLQTEEENDNPPDVQNVSPAAPTKKRAKDIMRQIDSDVASPVAAAFNDPSIDNAARMPELELDYTEPEQAAPVSVTDVRKEKVTARDAEASAHEIAAQIAETELSEKPVYCFPPIDLLKPSPDNGGDGVNEMRDNTRRLNETLESFKIEARIINVTRGPSVTRYEVELEKGVRLNKITTVADDIALSLGASGVRIAAVPGRISVVGIEVPNRAVTTVSLREVIESAAFQNAKSKSSFAVGKDIGGASIVGNIAKLPHMLIAGTTGSGKSVCMNSIIISTLYKASPDDVKLIMIDPKMVELGIYNGIPHLLIPVVTDPKKAAGSLQWAVSEMMRRYKAMSDAGVRDLESYNSIVEGQEDMGHKLPQVVVIIDELADLMLVAAKEVEESICRIAQMGRAAGIHLIIATQRPSADVITGLMKANIPSRIAFAVASAMESRIILDTQGAEKLVGRGDMLYAPIGSGKPKRVQGCFVSDPEVEAVANYVKSNFISDYDQHVMEEIEKKAAQTGNAKATVSDPEPNGDELDGDEMLPAAVDVILETGQASVSMLQRRLKLGYARAARIVDEMEEKGIVGPFQGSKPRTILVTKEQWEAMRAGQQPSQMAIEELSESDDYDPFN